MRAPKIPQYETNCVRCAKETRHNDFFNPAGCVLIIATFCTGGLLAPVLLAYMLVPAFRPKPRLVCKVCGEIKIKPAGINQIFEG
jgi:hypothetical protein